MKLREGNVFTGVCLSTGEGIVSLVPCPFRDGGGYVWGWVCPGVGMSGGIGAQEGGYVQGVGTPLEMGPQRWVCPGVNHPSQTWDTMGYGRQAGGTHPTGMLSCVRYIYT